MNEKISKAILEEVAKGKSIDAAIDAILGAGTFAKIASDLYDALRR